MTQEEARAALEKLRAWAQVASPTEIAELDPAIARLIPGQEVSNYPDLSREYQSDFVVDPAYKATLPDLQNGPTSLIKGAKKQIQHVGISNFRLPITYRTREGGDVTLESSITGTVSLDEDKKGRYDITKLSDPEEVESLITRYVAISDVLNPPQFATSAAVSLLSSSIGQFVPITIDIPALNAILRTRLNTPLSMPPKSAAFLWLILNGWWSG
jgi:hypothetical protein